MWPKLERESKTPGVNTEISMEFLYHADILPIKLYY